MATIKSYTDLEQSKKLAKILPIESADGWWTALNWQETEYYIEVKQDGINKPKKYVPCWSLTALLNVSPNGIVMNKDSQNGRYHFSSTHAGTYVTMDNPIDTCVAMIEKLHELNLL